MNLNIMEILNEAVELDASDIFLVAGSSPGFKVRFYEIDGFVD